MSSYEREEVVKNKIYVIPPTLVHILDVQSWAWGGILRVLHQLGYGLSSAYKVLAVLTLQADFLELI